MKKLHATLMILCAGPVWADCVLINDQDKELQFCDPSTNRGGKIKRVWLRAELPRTNSNGIRSLRVLREFDCPNEKQRMLQIESFRESNLINPIASGLVQDEWKYVSPGTVLNRLFELVCEKK